MNCISAADAFPTNSFYGNSNKRKLTYIEKSVEGTVKKNAVEKIPKSFKARITGPSVHWKTFYKQNEAFLYAKSKAADLHVFAYESEMLGIGKGHRMYLVTSQPVFWHYYSQLQQGQRHHYEVIPDGAVCKLYFDLEFMKHMNTAKDGAKMVVTFVKYVCLWLEYQFGIKCSMKDVLNLDSSTDSKFSRHLVFVLKNVTFCDNIHAGNFVHHILTQLSTRLCLDRKSEESINIENKSVSTIGHCDNNTGNENDNTHLNRCESVKNGGTSQEKMSNCEDTDLEQDKCGSETLHDEAGMEKNVFQHFTTDQLQSLFVYDKNGDECLFCDSGVYTKNRNFRLYLSSKLGKDNPLLLSIDDGYSGSSDDVELTKEELNKQTFMASLITNVRYTDKMRILTFETVDKAGQKLHPAPGERKMQAQNDVVEGNTTSPYPEVDSFITDLVQSAGNTGSIRHWTYFPQGEILVYEISRYRFCHNIGRHHKSNNIMLIVDLRRGVYYQKCHDYDCKKQNYKSADFPVPKEALPAHLFEDESFDEDDDEIIDAANELENQYKSSNSPVPSPGSPSNELDDMEDVSLINAADELERSLQEEK